MISPVKFSNLNHFPHLPYHVGSYPVIINKIVLLNYCAYDCKTKLIACENLLIYFTKHIFFELGCFYFSVVISSLQVGLGCQTSKKGLEVVLKFYILLFFSWFLSNFVGTSSVKDVDRHLEEKNCIFIWIFMGALSDVYSWIVEPCSECFVTFHGQLWLCAYLRDIDTRRKFCCN